MPDLTPNLLFGYFLAVQQLYFRCETDRRSKVPLKGSA